jgi:hypothetical protein
LRRDQVGWFSSPRVSPHGTVMVCGPCADLDEMWLVARSLVLVDDVGGYPAAVRELDAVRSGPGADCLCIDLAGRRCQSDGRRSVNHPIYDLSTERSLGRVLRAPGCRCDHLAGPEDWCRPRRSRPARRRCELAGRGDRTARRSAGDVRSVLGLDASQTSSTDPSSRMRLIRPLPSGGPLD